MEYLADSYAFIAALDNSPEYAAIVRKDSLVTTELHALEVASAILRRGGGAKLKQYLEPIRAKCVAAPHGVVEAAARFRHAQRLAGGNCSSIDAWGYATAQALGIPFLTGDEGFRGVPGVKFLKA